MTAWVSGWWLGVTGDHVYEHCPARLRSLATLRWCGWDRPGAGPLDVDGQWVCGWCARVHRARRSS